MGGNSSASAQPTASDIQRVPRKPKQPKQTSLLPRYVRSASQPSTQPAESSRFCGNCGMLGHKSGSSSYPAKGKECFRCHKLNHFCRCGRSSKSFLDYPKSDPLSIRYTLAKKQVSNCAPLLWLVITSVLFLTLEPNGQSLIKKPGVDFLATMGCKPLQLILPDTVGNKSRRWVRFHCLYSMKISQPVNFSFFVTTKGSNLMGVNLFDHLEFSIATQNQVTVLVLIVNFERWMDTLTSLGWSR